MIQPKDCPIVVLLDGDQYAKHYPLEQTTTILGRDETCDIVIPQRQISRQHVAFHREGDNRVSIEDMGSRNGTYVNGARLEGSRPLANGDIIHLALSIRLQFIADGITAPITEGIPDVVPSFFAPSIGGLRLDIEGRRVFIENVELNPPLSLPQYRLLELLYLNPNRVCTRDEVVNAVWPEAMGQGVSEQAIDALVRRLRDRLNEVAPEQQFIVTVRGHGFRLGGNGE